MRFVRIVRCAVDRILLLGCWIHADPAFAQLDITTERYDAARLGANLSETQLNASNVNAASFGKLWSYTVSGSVYAQPLYVRDVAIPGQGTHNVLYVVTMNDCRLRVRCGFEFRYAAALARYHDAGPGLHARSRSTTSSAHGQHHRQHGHREHAVHRSLDEYDVPRRATQGSGRQLRHGAQRTLLPSHPRARHHHARGKIRQARR